MRKRTDWTSLPDVVSALQSLLAHYEILGCTPGSSRLEGLIAHVEGPQELRDEFRNAQAAFAANAGHPEAITGLARVTWAAFGEPTADTLREIDNLGLAEYSRVPHFGTFGRLWCRRITDAAWTIWTLACLHDHGVRHIELSDEWLEDLRS